MLTSRAEHRVVLRHDNADLRLTPLARENGLVGEADWSAFRERRDALAASRRYADRTKLGAGTLARLGLPPGTMLSGALRRPEVSVADLAGEFSPGTAPEIATRTEIEIKMEGYVRRQQLAIERAARDEAVALPADLDYAAIRALSLEAREKLVRRRPRTLGAATRIPGLTPSDIALVSVHVHRRSEQPAAAPA